MFAMGYVCMCASVLYMSVCAQDSIYVTMKVYCTYAFVYVHNVLKKYTVNRLVHLHKNALCAQVCTSMYMYAL